MIDDCTAQLKDRKPMDLFEFPHQGVSIAETFGLMN